MRSTLPLEWNGSARVNPVLPIILVFELWFMLERSNGKSMNARVPFNVPIH